MKAHPPRSPCSLLAGIAPGKPRFPKSTWAPWCLALTAVRCSSRRRRALSPDGRFRGRTCGGSREILTSMSQGCSRGSVRVIATGASRWFQPGSEPFTERFPASRSLGGATSLSPIRSCVAWSGALVPRRCCCPRTSKIEPGRAACFPARHSWVFRRRWRRCAASSEISATWMLESLRSRRAERQSIRVGQRTQRTVLTLTNSRMPSRPSSRP